MSNRNKIIIILSIIFGVFGIILLITGFVASGYDIIAWFTSKYGIWFYTCIGFWGIIVALTMIGDKIKKL